MNIKSNYGLKTLVLISSVFSGSTIYAQDLPTFNSNIRAPVMEARDDTQYQLKDMPSSVIYEAPEGWNTISSIPDDYKKFTKFLNNLYKGQISMFWNQEDDHITLAIAPYEKYYSIAEVFPNEQDVSVVNKAGERHYFSDQYFKLYLKDNDKIEIISNLPKEYVYDNFIPWDYSDSYYVKYKNQTAGKMIWSNTLNTFVGGNISFSDVRQILKDSVNIIKKIDDISIEANYNNNALTYVITLEDLQISDPFSEDNAYIKLGNIQSYLVFNDINENSFSEFTDNLFLNSDKENLFKFDDNTEVPFASFQMSLDINNTKGKIRGYEEDQESLPSLVKEDFSIKNIALRLNIENLADKESSLSSQFLLYRDPIPIKDIFKYLPEISLLPNLIRGNLSSEAGAFINGRELFASLYDTNKEEKIWEKLVQQIFNNDAILDIDNIEIGHGGWNLLGNGKIQFISILNEAGFLGKLELGTNNFQLFSNIPDEIISSVPELSDINILMDLGLDNTELREKLNANWAFDIKFTDKDPLTINGQDVEKRFKIFKFSELMKDYEYLEYKNSK